MLRITLAAASFVLLGALATQAAPLDRPPFEVGGGPIEPGILDPVDDCLRFPQLCEPGDPPPDPCIEHPELCDPEPPDPCPAGQLCPVDLCELVPSLCEEPPIAEPPVAEPPEQEVFDHSLAGNAKVKGEGFKTSEPYTLSLNADTAAGTFLAMDGDGRLYSGRLAPKGKKGNKFSLFLDDSSSEAFSGYVVARGAAASGLAAGVVLGQSSKLTLTTNEDGSVSLKLKSEVLVDFVGAVVLKANLLSQ